MNVMGMEEKKNKRNTCLVTLPSPVYKMEADSFLVSEGVENKPDFPYWGKDIRLMG